MPTIKLLVRYYLYIIAVFFGGRLALFLWYFDRFSNDKAVDYWLSFLYGLKMDTIVGAVLLIIPLLLLTFAPKVMTTVADTLLKYYFLLVISSLIFIEVATFPFMAEFDVRPNYKFVEYLEFPRETINLLLANYKLAIFIATIIIAAFIFVFLKKYKSCAHIFSSPYLKRVILFIPLLLILFIGIRSSFGHRPANITDALHSPNRMLNEVTKNSVYSVAYAVYANQKYETNTAALYGKLDIEEAYRRVKDLLHITADDSLTLSRKEVSHFLTSKPKNLVVILEESLGYQFYSDKITPHLKQLSGEGIFFNNLFANGTRSIRGIAGTVSGIFSIPGKGVVKRNKSQADFFTFASLLKPLGYHTSFFYGGESRFDNMKGWFVGNGFDEIIDEAKFINPDFIGSWGVSDGDVLRRAHEEFKRHHAQQQKFASIIFSTTNHTPFDFPEKAITLIPGVAKKSVENAVKYADHTIGEFIEQAKKSDYYQDTVFLIIADHNIRVYGDDIVPVNMFRIPALILAAGLKPQIYHELATQPDALATALDIMGLDVSYPVMGHSIFSSKKQDLAFMQFNEYYALRIKDKVAVIRPNKKPLTFLYQHERLVKTKPDMNIAQDALAFITVLDYMYQNKLYR